MSADFDKVKDLYGYVPSLGANEFGAIICIVILAAQILFGTWYKQWFMLFSWTIGLILSIVGYAFRIKAADGFAGDMGYKAQYICFLIVPLFILAGIYFQMSKLLTIYGLNLAKLRPIHYTTFFVGADIFTIVMQTIGGGLTLSPQNNNEIMGEILIFSGCIPHAFTLLCFLGFFIAFTVQVRKGHKDQFDPVYTSVRDRPMFKFMIPAVYVAWTFVFVHALFKVVGSVNGRTGYFGTHEIYFLCFDGLLMILCMLTLTFVYPGLCYGKKVPIKVFGVKRVNDGENKEVDEKSETCESSY